MTLLLRNATKLRAAHRLALEGQTFGRWSVIRFDHRNSRGEILWLFRCQCGTERAVKANSLTRGRSESCGCHHRAVTTTHGMTRTPTFRSWESMKQRCLNPKAPDFSRYGGRGIEVYAPWINSFQTFLADMGLRPEGTTLDRIDNNGNYEPGNCRWAVGSRQQRNRRLTITVTHAGETLPIADWADRTGIPLKVLRWRVQSGWNAAKALTEPVMPGRGRKRAM